MSISIGTTGEPVRSPRRVVRSRPASERTVLELVEHIYGAAEPKPWPVVLERLSGALNTPITNIYSWDRLNQQGSAAVFGGIDESDAQLYQQYFSARNIFMLRGDSVLQPGRVCTSDELCPTDEVHRSEFYHEYMRPRRMSHGINAVVLKERTLTSAIGLIRLDRQPLFTQGEVRVLERLMAHLQRTFQLHQRLTALELHSRLTQKALDRWALGVIIIGTGGRVILTNGAAAAILAQKDGLTLEPDGLHGAVPAYTNTLRRLIAGATNARNGDQPGGGLALPRPSGKRPLNVLVTPACVSRTLVPVPGAAVILFVSDPDAEEPSSLQALTELYGLSHAEAALAAKLLEGKDLAEAADALFITRNTAKTHLRQIFEKTGTKRQAELLRLLLRGPAALRP